MFPREWEEGSCLDPQDFKYHHSLCCLQALRRRCAQECPFSPYFSPHEPQKFASVHKVFGASNVSKMLMEVPENQRADAANSLVYEADVRLRDPVYGCMGAISALQQQVQSLQAELNAVRAEILKYKYRESSGILSPSHASFLASGQSLWRRHHRPLLFLHLLLIAQFRMNTLLILVEFMEKNPFFYLNHEK